MSNLNLRYQPEFNSKQRLINPLIGVQDFMNIISITRTMYGNLNPERKGDEPFDVLKAVKETYKQIRNIRVQRIGKKMMGLNSHVYVAICLHFTFEVDGFYIPPSMFVYMIDDPKVNLETFEKYKRDPDKGFLLYFNRTRPGYLQRKMPSVYINNYLRNKFVMERDVWKQIEMIVKDYETNHLQHNDSSAHVLYAAILHIVPKYNSKIFGKPVSSFSKITKMMKKHY